MQDETVGYDSKQAEKFAEKVKSYVRLKELIMLASGDSIDFKSYEADMRFMIDNYIEADASRKLCDFDGMSLVDLVVEEGEKFVEKLPDSIKNNGKSVAETIVPISLVEPLIVATLPTTDILAPILFK